MYLLVGKLPIKSYIIYRTLFQSEEEAETFRKEHLKEYTFLSPWKLQQVVEHVEHEGEEPVLLAPISAPLHPTKE